MTDNKGPRWWLFLTPVYVILAVLLGRWIMQVNSPDVAVDGSFSGDGELAKKKTANYDPLLDDGTFSVRYQNSKQAAAARERQAKEREQFAAEQAEAAARARAAGGQAGRGGGLPAVRESSLREKEFLAKYDPALKQYQEYMRALGEKHWKKHAVVRQIDAEFAGMDRFMALRKQYDRDRDAYKWARGTLALPEVRSAILKYATSPSAVLAAIDFMSEALKHPPPKPIYNEMMNFVTKEPAAASLVNDASFKSLSAVDQAVPAAIEAGIDVSAVQNLGTQLTNAARSN